MLSVGIISPRGGLLWEEAISLGEIVVRHGTMRKFSSATDRHALGELITTNQSGLHAYSAVPVAFGHQRRLLAIY